MINVICLQLTQYLNRVFRMFTSCIHTRSKSVAKWYDCFHNHWIHAQIIIPYCQPNSLSAWLCWSALACISDSIPALHPIHDNPLAYQSGAFSVDFTSESQFNYLLP